MNKLYLWILLAFSFNSYADYHNDMALKAAKNGNLNLLRESFQKGASLYSKDWEGNTVLHLAAKHDRIEILNEVLMYGLPVNLENSEGSTPLILSSLEGNIEVVKTLLRLNADIEIQSKIGTALSLSIYNLKNDVAKLLLESGAEPDHIVHDGLTALMFSSISNNIEGTALLLEYDARTDFITVKTGKTALSFASENGFLQTISLLLKNGANPNIVKQNFPSPLIYGIRARSLEVVKRLVSAGADTNYIYNAFSANSKTALMEAASHGNSDIVDFLLKNMAQIGSLTDFDSKSPSWNALNYAAFHGHFDSMKHLIEAGSDVNNITRDGNTSLILAIANESDFNCVKLLVQNGADLDNQNLKGWTALMYASEMGDTNLVKLLLDNEANRMLVNDKGETAYYLAVKEGFDDIVKLFLQN